MSCSCALSVSLNLTSNFSSPLCRPGGGIMRRGGGGGGATVSWPTRNTAPTSPAPLLFGVIPGATGWLNGFDLGPEGMVRPFF